jgi:Glycosyl hydrolase family 76
MTRLLKLTPWLSLTIAVLLIAGLVVFQNARVPRATGQGANQSRSLYQDRALQAFAALQTSLSVPDGNHLYMEWYPRGSGDNTYSYLWPFSQLRQSVIDLANLPKTDSAIPRLADINQGLEYYWNSTSTTGKGGYDSYVPAPLGQGGDLFYDDNAWVALSDMQLYTRTGDQFALSRAKAIFDLAVSGWDTDTTHADPGGVFWTQASWSQDRNTVSNMPNALVGLRLYQVTKDPYYLTWAQKMIDWTNKYLLAPNGLYWDHVDLQGDIEKTQWSYNQGIPIGVYTLLYQITGDQTNLHRAQDIAAKSVAYYVNGGRLYTQPPYFNAIYMRNLLFLASLTKDATMRGVVENYANTMWALSRDQATSLFHVNKAAQTELIEQASIVQINALLAQNDGRATFW